MTGLIKGGVAEDLGVVALGEWWLLPPPGAAVYVLDGDLEPPVVCLGEGASFGFFGGDA